MEKPTDLDKFYLELEYEWKKYKTLRIDGLLIKDTKVLMKDANFSRDDFMMLEYQIPTTNENGYALVEIDKGSALDEQLQKQFEDLMKDEEVKEMLNNPSTLKFTTIPIKTISKSDSVLGV